MFLQETRAVDAVGAAHDRERPPDDVRQNSLGACKIVFRQLALGDPIVRIEQLVGMGNMDARDDDILSTSAIRLNLRLRFPWTSRR